MHLSIKRAAIALAAIMALAIVAGLATAWIVGFPGGMRPSYQATDRDARLTPIAREAIPVIKSIDRYYSTHGQCPRPTESGLAELRKDLPEGLIATLRGDKIEFRDAKAVTGWLYYSSDEEPTVCQLWRKLGWDPALVWLRRGDQTRWIFVPGDGSDQKMIDLDIRD
jgi:hypothetical protein